jgi:hypothetical protein
LQRPIPDKSNLFSKCVNPLSDTDTRRALLGNEHAPEEAALLATEEPAVLGGYVGWHAARLAEALKESQPDQRPASRSSLGRYTIRQEIRTPNTPHLARQEMEQATRSLALYVLVDRSGSMDRFEQAVREALMTIYLAAVQCDASSPGIPIGMAYFGEDDFYSGDSPLPPDRITVEQTVAEVAPLSTGGYEPAKVLNKSGVRLNKVAIILGHSNLNATRIYTSPGCRIWKRFNSIWIMNGHSSCNHGAIAG